MFEFAYSSKIETLERHTACASVLSERGKVLYFFQGFESLALKIPLGYKFKFKFMNFWLCFSMQNSNMYLLKIGVSIKLKYLDCF